MSEASRRFPTPWRADKTPGGYAIRDASGRIVRIAGRATDITEAKILELSLR